MPQQGPKPKPKRAATDTVALKRRIDTDMAMVRDLIPAARMGSHTADSTMMAAGKRAAARMDSLTDIRFAPSARQAKHEKTKRGY